jgi:hypothetical protein
MHQRRDAGQDSRDLQQAFTREVLGGVAEPGRHREDVARLQAEIDAGDTPLLEEGGLHRVGQLVVDERATAQHAQHEHGSDGQTGAHRRKHRPAQVTRRLQPHAPGQTPGQQPEAGAE